VLAILAAAKHSGRLCDPVLAQAVFALLARRFRPREQVLIKPSNSANTLIAETAALVWRLQMDGLEAASRQLGGRARSLDCRGFLDDPGPVLGAVDDFLGLGIGREALDQVVAGPLFTRDVKQTGESFDPKSRTEQGRRLRVWLRCR